MNIPKKITFFLLSICLLIGNSYALPKVEVMALPALNAENDNWIGKGPRYTSYWAKGISMYPLVHEGDTLLAERRGFNTPIYKGDYAVYLNGQVLTSHEVIEVRSGWVLIKGLNNPVADGWMPASKVIYLVRRIVRVAR